MLTVLLLTVTLGIGLERTALTAEACRFVQAYRTIQKTNAPMGFWERLVYSVALAKARAANEAALSEPNV